MDGVRSGLGNFDEPRQFEYEVARAKSAERGHHQVVEVGDGMPRDECPRTGMLKPVDKVGSRS